MDGDHAIAVPAPHRVRGELVLVGQRECPGHQVAGANPIAAREREIGAAEAAGRQSREHLPVVECHRETRAVALELARTGLYQEVLEPTLAVVALERDRRSP